MDASFPFFVDCGAVLYSGNLTAVCAVYEFRLFRIFPILRTDGMAPFCNLFIERPS